MSPLWMMLIAVIVVVVFLLRSRSNKEKPTDAPMNEYDITCKLSFILFVLGNREEMSAGVAQQLSSLPPSMRQALEAFITPVPQRMTTEMDNFLNSNAYTSISDPHGRSLVEGAFAIARKARSTPLSTHASAHRNGISSGEGAVEAIEIGCHFNFPECSSIPRPYTKTVNEIVAGAFKKLRERGRNLFP